MVARVACAGECMVELREQPDGSLIRGYGGDTLNTAVYLARLGVPVDYVTALGDDAWSDEMVAGWQAEGVNTGHVHRLPGRLPGLYIIQTDATGERRFSYWRDSAAARHVFDHADLEALSGFDVLYVSGITLSIFDRAARETLLATLRRLRQRGGRVVFDTNFRPRGWPDRDVARSLYEQVFTLSDMVFASAEDLVQLFGPDGDAALLRHADTVEIILKAEQPSCRVLHGGIVVTVAAEPVAKVVDTTAAGDSFAAAYLAARLRGAEPIEAARAGHALAGLVVGHSGAVIPRSAMASLMQANRDGAVSAP
ncbi:sugar kinase [Lichenihabitans sp. Uapishka_5]|uniref:sugar kinase n=1 Tax=Lichenihabitans sp. Uapishka_5 TaxID=3037302 RepID=UPI0029E7D0B0|nr:sugar kinase [Lichenihabitans sp. Uapishka_5]MDX7949679.1 sugar kinase [Lichenihabitans sp. Uapishka_5]